MFKSDDFITNKYGCKKYHYFCDSAEHPDFIKSWSLENLQPMWAGPNRRKSNKFAGGY